MSPEPIIPEQFISRIDSWIEDGGKFPDFGYHDVSTVSEAQAVVRAVKRGDLDWSEPPVHIPNIHSIASLLQSNSDEISDYFRKHVAKPLRNLIAKNLASTGPVNPSRLERYAHEKSADGYLFALQALIRFGYAEDVNLLAQAARKTGYNDQYFWSSIFGHAKQSLSKPEAVLDALKDPLPEKFCKIAYLDFVNVICFENLAKYHPFDDADGFEFLLQLIDQTDQGYDSYVNSVAKAAPFLSKKRSDDIVEIIRQHRFEHIRPEADWAKARLGDDDGIEYLCNQFQTVQFHTRASKYLSVLGVTPPDIQATQTDQFKALVAYSDWMTDEQDFCGYPLESIEVLNQIDVLWPTPNNIVPFWRVAYETKDFFAEDETANERIKGISLVSPIGFSRFFEENNKRYVYSESVEFDESYKKLVEKWPNQDWCAKRLEELNPNLFDKQKPSFFKRIFK